MPPPCPGLAHRPRGSRSQSEGHCRTFGRFARRRDGRATDRAPARRCLAGWRWGRSEVRGRAASKRASRARAPRGLDREANRGTPGLPLAGRDGSREPQGSASRSRGSTRDTPALIGGFCVVVPLQIGEVVPEQLPVEPDVRGCRDATAEDGDSSLQFTLPGVCKRRDLEAASVALLFELDRDLERRLQLTLRSELAIHERPTGQVTDRLDRQHLLDAQRATISWRADSGS